MTTPCCDWLLRWCLLVESLLFKKWNLLSNLFLPVFQSSQRVQNELQSYRNKVWTLEICIKKRQFSRCLLWTSTGWQWNSKCTKGTALHETWYLQTSNTMKNHWWGQITSWRLSWLTWAGEPPLSTHPRGTEMRSPSHCPHQGAFCS